jgi:hypothetical protein
MSHFSQTNDRYRARVSKDVAATCFETHRGKCCDAPQHEADWTSHIVARYSGRGS